MCEPQNTSSWQSLRYTGIISSVGGLLASFSFLLGPFSMSPFPSPTKRIIVMSILLLCFKVNSFYHKPSTDNSVIQKSSRMWLSMTDTWKVLFVPSSLSPSSTHLHPQMRVICAELTSATSTFFFFQLLLVAWFTDVNTDLVAGSYRPLKIHAKTQIIVVRRKLPE